MGQASQASEKYKSGAINSVSKEVQNRDTNSIDSLAVLTQPSDGTVNQAVNTFPGKISSRARFELEN